MKIISRAPTRIGLIGGGTDVNPFAAEYGGKILSLAVTLYHHVTLSPSDTSIVTLKAMSQERVFALNDPITYGEDPDFDLLRAVINYVKPYLKKGFTLEVVFSGLSTSGLGTSASVAVAVIGAFNAWLKLGLSRLDIAFLAWNLENNELGWITGKQDQLAAAFGGINILYFGPGERVGVEPLSLSPSQASRLKEWVLMVFLHKTRNSGSVQKKLVQNMDYFVKQKALFALKDSVNESVQYLQAGNFLRLGKVLDEVWVNKKTANPNATNEQIDHVYSLLLTKGAIGGKVMGAGGGGHMFFLCPPEKKREIVKACSQEGLSCIDFDFDWQGLTVEVRNE